LPSGAALQEFRERAYVQNELARLEREDAGARELMSRRAEIAGEAHTNLPQSQQTFAWGAERISSALLSKFDSFTARHEDHTRKLLWTFGQDPHFKETGSRQAIRVTPSNFPRVCDRFGIRCDEQQARTIFAQHGLPEQGVSMHKLTSKFIDSPLDMANIVRDQARRMHGDAARPPTAVRETTPQPPYRPYKNASVHVNAWAQHASESAGGGDIG